MITVTIAFLVAVGIFGALWAFVRSKAIRIWGKDAAMTFTPVAFRPVLNTDGTLQCKADGRLVHVPPGSTPPSNRGTNVTQKSLRLWRLSLQPLWSSFRTPDWMSIPTPARLRWCCSDFQCSTLLALWLCWPTPTKTSSTDQLRIRRRGTALRERLRVWRSGLLRARLSMPSGPRRLGICIRRHPYL